MPGPLMSACRFICTTTLGPSTLFTSKAYAIEAGYMVACVAPVCNVAELGGCVAPPMGTVDCSA
eukprot:scaffold42043_cov73-Attheya_sp.AAC.2